jgi:hypothetical protein
LLLCLDTIQFCLFNPIAASLGLSVDLLAFSGEVFLLLSLTFRLVGQVLFMLQPALFNLIGLFLHLDGVLLAFDLGFLDFLNSRGQGIVFLLRFFGLLMGTIDLFTEAFHPNDNVLVLRDR